MVVGLAMDGWRCTGYGGSFYGFYDGFGWSVLSFIRLGFVFRGGGGFIWSLLGWPSK